MFIYALMIAALGSAIMGWANLVTYHLVLGGTLVALSFVLGACAAGIIVHSDHDD